MKYISGADERRVLTTHLHIGFCVLDVVGQLVVPDGLDDPGRHAYRHRIVGDDHSFRHQRPGPDDAVFAQNDLPAGVAVEHGVVMHVET